jgi:hypothetical protein
MQIRSRVSNRYRMVPAGYQTALVCRFDQGYRIVTDWFLPDIKTL